MKRTTTKPVDTGGHAYPSEFQSTQYRNYERHTGMTLRDHFAGQAALGLIFAYSKDHRVQYDEIPMDLLAERAYELADEMVARKRETEAQ